MTGRAMPEARAPRRIAVFGSPGAGKTRLSPTLADQLGLPIVHLDDLYWGPGWRRPDEETWHDRLREAVRAEKWLIDGNYLPSARLRVEAADLVVLVCAPVTLCLWRIVRRALRINRGGLDALPRAVREQARAGERIAATRDFGALAWKVLRYRSRELPALAAMLQESPGTPVLIICDRKLRRGVRSRLPAELAARAHWLDSEHAAQAIGGWPARAGTALPRADAA
jgi:adenylate kinase family enzyme